MTLCLIDRQLVAAGMLVYAGLLLALRPSIAQELLQVIPVAKRVVEGSHLAAAWRQSQCTPHIFGLLPGRHERATQPDIASEPKART